MESQTKRLVGGVAALGAIEQVLLDVVEDGEKDATFSVRCGATVRASRTTNSSG